jgi:hypothetical protein
MLKITIGVLTYSLNHSLMHLATNSLTGVVRLYGITRDKMPEFLYLVKVSTDGDDGWLELFHNNNRLLTHSSTYLLTYVITHSLT